MQMTLLLQRTVDTICCVVWCTLSFSINVVLNCTVIATRNMSTQTSVTEVDKWVPAIDGNAKVGTFLDHPRSDVVLYSFSPVCLSVCMYVCLYLCQTVTRKP